MHRKERGFCMDKMIHRRLLLFYLLFAAASGAVLAIARVLMMYQWYDPIGQMYERGTSIPVVFRILTVVACGVLCTSFFLFRKKRSAVDFRSTTLFTVFSSSLCSFLMLAYLFVSLYTLYSTNFISLSALQSHSDAASNERLRAFFYILHLLLLFPAALYFFRVAAVSRNSGNGFCILSMVPIVWGTVFLIAMYLDISVSFNSPDKLLGQLVLIFLMLYLVYETRYNMGIPRPRLYFPCAFLCIVLIMIYAIPDLLLNSLGTWRILGDNTMHAFGQGTVYYVMLLSFALYIFSRCLSFLRTPEEAPHFSALPE